MTVLSVTAIAVAAERFARAHAPATPPDLVRHLCGELGIDIGRAIAGIQHAVRTGRLRTTDRGLTSGRTS